MKVNYKALAELIALAEINKRDPMIAKLYGVFMKRGISLSEANEMLLEMVTLIGEMEQEQGENEH